MWKNKVYGSVKLLLLVGMLGVLLAGCASQKGDADKMPADQIEKEEAQSEADAGDTVSQTDEIKTNARIICWGDSLTYGTGSEGHPYPALLEEKTGLSVKNYGVQGETAKQIAIRMGLYPMTTSAFFIPEDTTPVELNLFYDKTDPIMLRLGDVGLNPCTIGGVEGALSYNKDDGKYYFTRSVSGTGVLVEEGSEVMTYAAGDRKSDDIIVIFAGSNDRPTAESVAALIETEQQMINYLGSDKYIVVGLTSKSMVPEIEAVNQALQDAFGTHFLDVRSYLLKNGLKDAKITPTEQDNADITAGEIPGSLRIDEVHGVPAFYSIIAEQLYEKMSADGYFAAP